MTSAGLLLSWDGLVWQEQLIIRRGPVLTPAGLLLSWDGLVWRPRQQEEQLIIRRGQVLTSAGLLISWDGLVWWWSIEELENSQRPKKRQHEGKVGNGDLFSLNEY